MRIHITGMSPRMVSSRARERITFARSLEQALTGMGHELHRGPDDPWDADLVIGGVTSALSPGATYALPGLAHIGAALRRDVPLLLFVDDPDLGKIRAGAQSVLRSTDRLYSDYLMSKRVRASRSPDAHTQVQIAIAIEMLDSETWPPVLVPLHPWASPAIVAKRLGITSEVLPVDVSSAIELPPLPFSVPAQAQVWLTDRHYSAALLEPERVRWPVIPVNSADLPDPARVYAVARGVHQGVVDRMPGWWTPTPLYAAHADTVYLCDSEESTAIGTDTPYYLTPDQVEACNSAGHTLLAERQREHLKEISWDSTTLSSRLTDSIGRVTSSGTPGTRTATSATS